MAFQFDPQGFPRIKTANLLRKLCVLSQKNLKKKFFGVFRAALKRFGIVLYDSDDAQTYRMAFQLDARGNLTLKTATFFGKMSFTPKNVKKVGFFGVFRSALKRFGFLFYDSDDAQNHHLAAQLDAPGAAALKKRIL